jgi:hypothetical protein
MIIRKGNPLITTPQLATYFAIFNSENAWAT